MIRMLKTAASCFALGFVMPTLAFATIDFSTPAETPQKSFVSYLFQLSYADAEEAIGFALADKGAGTKVAAVINGHKEDPIFSFNKPLAVEIRGLQFDKSSSRWNANLMFVSENAVVSAMPVSGRYEETIELPVLKRQIRSGDVISENDLQLRNFPLSATRSDVVTDLSSLIGKSPVRTISMNRPIRGQEIAMPSVVKKNDLVKMTYKSGGMLISDNGQAMEDGAQGSLINVRNVASKKMIRAMVISANEVEIAPAGAQASQRVGKDAYEIN